MERPHVHVSALASEPLMLIEKGRQAPWIGPFSAPWPSIPSLISSLSLSLSLSLAGAHISAYSSVPPASLPDACRHHPALAQHPRSHGLLLLLAVERSAPPRYIQARCSRRSRGGRPAADDRPVQPGRSATDRGMDWPQTGRRAQARLAAERGVEGTAPAAERGARTRGVDWRGRAIQSLPLLARVPRRPHALRAPGAAAGGAQKG